MQVQLKAGWSKVAVSYQGATGRARAWHRSLSARQRIILWFTVLTLVSLGLVALLVLYDSIGGYDEFAIVNYRLPKIPLMVTMGAGASVSALFLQKLTRNKLADIGLIGVSDGGVLMLSLLSVYAPSLTDSINNQLVYSLVIPVTIGAASLVTISLLYILSVKRGVSPRRVVLIGIGLHVLLAGAATFVVYFNDGYQMNFFIRYLTGFIETKPMLVWAICGGIVLVCIMVSIPLWKKIDILASSEQVAHAVGVRKEVVKFVVFMLVSVITGATVAAVGSVALLGVLAPNMALAMFGSKMSALVPGTILIGVNTVMFAQFMDINLLHVGAPVGIMIQLIIAPYFVYRVFRKER